MGLRKIDDDIDFREAMKKKGAELKIKEISSKARVENITKEKLAELAKKHGVLLALTPELKEEVRYLQEKYNIPSSKIITEQITEEEVLGRFSRIDDEKLGMLAYQRVLIRKEEIGVGLIPISEVYDMVNTGELKGTLDIKDVIKAMNTLKKKSVIEDVKKLDSGVIMVQFFPIEYTGDEVKVIELAKQKGFLSLEEVCSALEWSQDRALRTLESLEQGGLAKFRENIIKGKQWYFPSV